MNRSAHVEERRGTLKRRISDVEAELLSLKMTYNTLSPINCLPDDILLNIFAVLRGPVKRKSKKWQKENAKWLRVTGVCRHWRSVALACGSLWSDLLSVTPELIQLMLHRSGTAPLSFTFHLDRRVFIDAVTTVLSQNHRLRRLNISGDIRTMVLSKMIPWTAPVLETLILKDVDSGDATVLPGNPPPSCYPQLKHLLIQWIGTPRWENVPFGSSLTYLKLGFPTTFVSESVARPSGEIFLNALRPLHLLQTLDLCECLPSGDHFPSPPVMLPALRTINLRDNMPSIWAFFGVLRIPAVSIFWIHFIEQFAIDLNVLECGLANLSTAWRGRTRNQVLGLRIVEALEEEEGQFYEFYFDGLPSERHGTTRPTPQAGPVFRLLFRRFWDETFIFQILQLAGSTVVDLSPVRSIRFGGQNGCGYRGWRLLGGLEHLENLAITEECLKELMPVLNETFSLGNAPHSNRPLFPALSTLEIGVSQAREPVAPQEVVAALNRRPESHRLSKLRVDDERGHLKELYEFALRSLPVSMAVEYSNTGLADSRYPIRSFGRFATEVGEDEDDRWMNYEYPYPDDYKTDSDWE